MSELTKAELDAIDRGLEEDGCYGFLSDHHGTIEAVRGIVAARLSEQREQIAQAIETAGVIRDLNADWRDGVDEAARIARGDA